MMKTSWRLATSDDFALSHWACHWRACTSRLMFSFARFDFRLVVTSCSSVSPATIVAVIVSGLPPGP